MTSAHVASQQGDDREGHNGEGHSQEVTMIVNSRPKLAHKGELSFAEIVALANLPSGENVTYTVTHRRGPSNRPDGTLTEGETVKVKEGMVFDVTATDKS